MPCGFKIVKPEQIQGRQFSKTASKHVSLTYNLVGGLRANNKICSKLIPSRKTIVANFPYAGFIQVSVHDSLALRYFLFIFRSKQ